MDNKDRMVGVEINTVDEMQDFAQKVADFICSGVSQDNAVVLLLEGDLGAGKTTFTQCLAYSLGISEHITSPTFVIQKIYQIPDKNTTGATNNLSFKHLIHIDAYRFENAAQSHMLHLDESFSVKTNIICIEWPELIADALPAQCYHIHFHWISETERRLETDIAIA